MVDWKRCTKGVVAGTYCLLACPEGYSGSGVPYMNCPAAGGKIDASGWTCNPRMARVAVSLTCAAACVRAPHRFGIDSDHRFATGHACQLLRLA